MNNNMKELERLTNILQEAENDMPFSNEMTCRIMTEVDKLSELSDKIERRLSIQEPILADCENNQRTDKPWGYEILWAKTDNYAAKLLHINAGESLSLQYHEEKEETLYVLEGIMYMRCGPEEDIYFLTPGETMHVPPMTIHTMEALEDGDVTVIEVSTPQLSDVVRIEDRYGRVGAQ